MTREELVKELKYTMKKHEHDRVDTFGTNISLMCKDILDYLEQELKMGHWTEHKWAEEIDGCLISNFECSCCHTWKRDESNYCPECGAKMESGW